MRTCVFILPLLVACGFASNPLPTDHELDPRVFSSDGVEALEDGGGAFRDSAVDEGAAGAAADAAPAAELDAATPTQEDATTHNRDAAQPPADAAVEPDAATDAGDLEPPTDAATEPPDYTDELICQQCSTTSPCGPESVCHNEICLPLASTGRDCADVCRGLLPVRGSNGACTADNDLNTAIGCNTIRVTYACWN